MRATIAVEILRFAKMLVLYALFGAAVTAGFYAIAAVLS